MSDEKSPDVILPDGVTIADFGLEEWDEVGAAMKVAAERFLCPGGEPWVGPDAVEGSSHGHTDCWAVGTLIKELRRLRGEV